MKILVYGAGVMGCQLVHRLCKRKRNEVTLLARGEWKNAIDKEGLVIRHSGYFHTTKDKVRTIDKLEKMDEYDLIFVVMRYNQVFNVLRNLGENISSNIILIGNNLDPKLCEQEINKWSKVKKNIAFGLFDGAGYRDKNVIVSISRVFTKITIGGVRKRISNDFKNIIELTFKRTGYKPIFEEDMEAWLLSHVAQMLPGCYLCYTYNLDIDKVTKKDAAMAVVATVEAHRLLKSLGYPICPEGKEEAYEEDIEKHAKKVHFRYTRMIGKFFMSNFCKHIIDEMNYIDIAFNEFREKSSVEMNVWDELRERARRQIAVQENSRLALQFDCNFATLK